MDTIELTNFLNHEHTMLPLEGHVTLVQGPNGSGKSAIVAALEWALTGTCRGLDATGKRTRELVRDEGEECSVRLYDQNGVFLERRFHRDSGTKLAFVGSPPGPVGATESALWEKLGVRRVTPAAGRVLVRNAVNAGDLSTWTSATFFDVVAMLAPGDAEAIMGDLAAELREQAIADDVKRDIGRVVTQTHQRVVPAMVGQGRVQIVKALEDAFAEQRRLAKKSLQTFQARAGAGAGEATALSRMKSEELDREREGAAHQVQDCRNQVGSLQRSIGHLEERARGQAQAGRRKAELQEKLVILERTIATEPSDEDFKASEALVEEARAAYTKAKSQSQTTPDGFVQACTIVLDQVEVSKKSAAILRKIVSDPPVEGDREALTSEVARIRDAFDAAASGHTELAQHREKAIRAQEAIAAVKEELEVQAGLSAEDPLEEQRGDLEMQREALEKWTVNLRQAEAHERELAAEVERRKTLASASSAQGEELAATVQALELLVAAMRTDRVRLGRAAELTRELMAEVSESTQSMGLGSFTADRRMFLEGRSFDLLSESEILRFGAAVQAAVSRRLGFPWLLIDGSDVLVGADNRGPFLRWVHGQADHFERTVLLGAAAQPAATIPPGWAAYWIENGELVDPGVPA